MFKKANYSKFKEMKTSRITFCADEKKVTKKREVIRSYAFMITRSYTHVIIN